MRYEMFSCSPAPQVKVASVMGDVQITGWERNEISAKTSGSKLEVIQSDDSFVIQSDDDLILYLPCQSQLDVGAIAGDMDLRVFENMVAIQSVGGDLQVNSAGGLKINTIGGDLSCRTINGACQVDNVGGDASLTDISGEARLGSVGADLYVRGIDGSLSAQVGADAVLFVTPAAEQKYKVAAGSDILIRLPLDASANLNLTGGGMDAIRVNFPGVELDEMHGPCQFTLGAGEADIHLTAGSDIIVTHNAEEWQSMADFGPEAWGARDFPGVPPIPPIPTIPPIPPISPIPGMPNLADEINERIHERLGRQTDRMGRRMEEVGRRTEAAMRRAEQKIRAAEQRQRFSVGGGGRKQVNINFGGQPAAPQSEPVSDEERLTILKMLQEKKISLQDAEKLLAALEGK